MHNSLKALAGAALAALSFAPPLQAADNFTPTNSVNQNFRSKDIGSGTPLHLPFQIPSDVTGAPLFSLANPGAIGLDFGGSLLTLGQKSKALALPVALPLDPDILNAAATITAADAASTTATGQNGVSVVSGTPTAGSVYSYAVNGQSEADFTVTGTFAGTLVFEGSANSGLTYTPRSAHVMGTKYRTSTITAPGIFHINAAGLTNIRVRATALASGTPSVQLNTTSGTGSVYVMNPIELTDNTTGLSASIKAGGSAATTDPAITVYDAVIAALTGSPSDAAFNGTGNPTSLFGLFKGLFAQAAPTSNPGTSIGSTTPVPGFQGVTGGVPLPISGTVTTQASVGMATPAYRIASAAAGNNAQVFATGAKRMLQAYFCNKTTTDRVVKFYDKASAPVPGTDAIVTSIPAPAGSCPAIDFSSGGFPFANGLAIAITLPGDSDTGSTVAAGDITGLNIQHN